MVKAKSYDALYGAGSGAEFVKQVPGHGVAACLSWLAASRMPVRSILDLPGRSTRP
jgi:hypothetical protein|tara:strand:+ start:499 stop:666 length:168 start_codon:yes stop_codon:yes gene_type:complete